MFLVDLKPAEERIADALYWLRDACCQNQVAEDWLRFIKNGVRWSRLRRTFMHVGEHQFARR